MNGENIKPGEPGFGIMWNQLFEPTAKGAGETATRASKQIKQFAKMWVGNGKSIICQNNSKTHVLVH